MAADCFDRNNTYILLATLPAHAAAANADAAAIYKARTRFKLPQSHKSHQTLCSTLCKHVTNI
eukprot:3973640-Amphidinium_carterae.1